MKITMSNFLTERKLLLRQIIEKLGPYFPYVSILGTNSKGKQYLVQKSGIAVSDSRWAERGFVVRVYNGKNYSEVSFNELPIEISTEFIRDLCAQVQEPLTRLRSGPVKLTTYPLIQEEKIRESLLGQVAIHPQMVTTEQKLQKMSAIKEMALKQSPLLVDFKVRFEEVQVSKLFISGPKELEQSYIWSQGYLMATVRKEKQTKYAYKAFSGLKGVELLDEMAGEYEKVIAQAQRLLEAKAVEPGEYDVICSPEIAGLIAHEAFGHGVEMDMFVKNRAKALEYLGKPVASEKVTMHDGADAAHNVSSYLFDDEGVIATDTVVIDHGILKTGISDRLSALKLGTEPTGNGKRESFERKAYARMTNTFFAGGRDRLEEMIASIQHGYLLDGTMSGMEDPKNWGIQCMIMQGEEIKEGKLTGAIISPVIMTGYVPDVLKAVTMVTAEVNLFGSGACGKGHKEWVKVSDGGPYIKTRVRLG